MKIIPTLSIPSQCANISTFPNHSLYDFYNFLLYSVGPENFKNIFKMYLMYAAVPKMIVRP